MLEVVMLGTGTPMADPSRCGSGVAIIGPESWVLVDCGRGVTQRAIQARLDLTAIDAVLLTHYHSDHISDLPTLAIARWTAGATSSLTVISPAGPCERFATRCLRPFEDQAFFAQANPNAGVRPVIECRAFAPTPDPTEILTTGPWRIASALVDHHPIESAVGYRIEDHWHSVAVSGDTASCDGMAHLAAGADILIHEALDSDKVRPDLLTWNAGANTVGALADKAQVRRLVLTHLLPPPTTSHAEQVFEDQARSGGYTGPVDVATDLLRLSFD